MTAIFISHRSLDAVIAAELKAWLAKQGHTQFFLDFDPVDGIPAGADWEQAIYQHLRKCQAILIVLTPDWLASRWCFAERTLASEQGKAVFVVKAKPVPDDPVFASTQVVDLTVDRDAALEKLARGLKLKGLDPRDVFDWKPKRSIYPGLFAFEESDAAIFFGRNKESRDVVEQLERLRRRSPWNERLLLITGASGSGKSSLMRAGVLPRLKTDPDHWLVPSPIRRGRSALAALADALRSLATDLGAAAALRLINALDDDGTPVQEKAEQLRHFFRELRRLAGHPEATLLIAIDQTEELLTRHPPTDDGFLALLGTLLADQGQDLMVLATIRSDMLGVWQGHDAVCGRNGLPPLPFKLFPLGPMPLDRVPAVIREPAKFESLQVDDELLDAIGKDLTTEDALPLLAYTLRTLYEGRDVKANRLTLAQYREFGGLKGAIQQEAERTIDLQNLSQQELDELRDAFIPNLVCVTEQDSFTRQPASRSSFSETAIPLINKLIDARLLVSDGDQVEVAHEALFRAWPILKSWLDEDSDRLKLLASLQLSAKEWDRLKRRKDFLLHRGNRLKDAEELGRNSRFGRRLDVLVRDYLDACRNEENTVLRRRRLVLFASIGILITATVVAFFLENRAREAEVLANRQRMEAQISESNALASRAFSALARGEIATAIQLSSKALPRDWSQPERPLAPAALQALFAAVENNREGHVLTSGSGQVFKHLQFSPDSRYLAAHGPTGAAVWNVQTGRRVPDADVWTEVTAAAFAVGDKAVIFGTADGRVVRVDPEKRGTRTVWDPQVGAISALVAAADGIIAVAGTEGRIAIGQVGDASGAVTLKVGEHPIRELAILPGRRLAIILEDWSVSVWNIATRSPEIRFGPKTRGVKVGAFFPERMLLSLVGADGGFGVWEVGTGVQLVSRTFEQGEVQALRFSPSGDRLFVGLASGRVMAWNGAGDFSIVLANAEEASRLAASEIGVIATAGDKETVALWDDTGARIGSLHGFAGRIRTMSFNDSGDLLATSDEGGAVRLWNGARRDWHVPFSAHGGFNLTSVIHSRDGSRFATTAWDGRVLVWDARTLEQVAELPSAYTPTGDDRQDVVARITNSSDFSPDGRTLAVASLDGRVLLWDIETRSPRVLLKMGDGAKALSVRFDHAGSRLAATSEDGSVWVMDIASGSLQAKFENSSQANGVAFHPQNKDELVSVHNDGSLLIHDLAARSTRAITFDDALLSVVYDRSGDRILVTASDGLARLIVPGPEVKVKTFARHRHWVGSAAFGPGDNWIATASDDRSVMLWDVESGAMIARLDTGDMVKSVSVDPQDGTVVAAGFDGQAHVWRDTAGIRKGSIRQAVATIRATFNHSPFPQDGDASAGLPPEADAPASSTPADALSAAMRCDLAADPDDPNKNGRGMPAHRLNTWKLIPICQQAITAHPQEPRFQYQLGRIFEASGDIAQAREHYRLAAGADYGIAHYALARLLRDTEPSNAQAEEMAGHLRFASEQGVGKASWWLAKLQRAGDSREFVARAARQSVPEAHMWMASAWEEKGIAQADLEKALFHYTVAAELFVAREEAGAAARQHENRARVARLLPANTTGSVFEAASAEKAGQEASTDKAREYDVPTSTGGVVDELRSVRAFERPQIDGRTIDGCIASSLFSGAPGEQCGDPAQRMIASHYCRAVGYGNAVSWHTEDTQRFQRSVKLLVEPGPRVDLNHIWAPEDRGGYIFATISCR